MTEHRLARLGSILSTLILTCTMSAPSLSASLSDPIIETPRGSIFQLRSELEIPANRDFMLLGKDQLVSFQNDLSQTLNREAGRYDYTRYRNYQRDWIESASETYFDCLERHRIYYKSDYGSGGSNVILNQGRNNTNIIINNNQTPKYGSYIGDNPCIKPEHTLAFLLIDSDESEGGGFFRAGYEFETGRVEHRTSGYFNIVTINFDHDVIKGIQILTTQSPELIRINQLNYVKPGKGFWGGLGSAINGMTQLGGNTFSVHLPKKRYFE